ncbi:hypothetical protein PR048_027368 [Dryococelus australis]|uniref:Fibronectin type-III domain-containing protein n=1 Tax=Dryococelus australis TaxID=614101 RepID=A0ABQ9GGM0_9NEOP|nr:hypothetical protein PR048_027368 [Dryococelus australis]
MLAGPGNVVNLTSERLSSKRVRLAWAAPTSPSTCTVLYQLSYCSSPSYWQQDCNHTTLSLPVNTTEVSLRVEPCRYNHVSVTAVGDEGNSSAEMLVVSPRANNPQPPTKLEVDVVNSTTFTLSWEDPQDDRTECRLGYRICAGVAGHEDYDCMFEPRHLTYPDTRSTWTNSHSPTAACTSYTTSVSTVYNSLDLHGTASDTASITFHTAPENVADLKTTYNQTTISLEWSESQSECADHYVVSWCNVPYPWYDNCRPETHNTTTSVTSFHIAGLSACSYYWVAFSTVGEDGLSSETKELVITPPVADEVRSLDVMYEHGSQFAASWDVVGGDACVSSYRVCWRASGAEQEECDHSRLNNYESRYNLSLLTCSNYTLDVVPLDVYNDTSDSVTAYFATGMLYHCFLSYRSSGFDSHLVMTFTLVHTDEDKKKPLQNYSTTALSLAIPMQGSLTKFPVEPALASPSSQVADTY